MRHRRRYTTQTIQKKKRATSTYPAYPRKKSSSLKIFRYIAVFIILSGIVYAGITYVYPRVIELLPDNITQQNEPVTQQEPVIPVEEDLPASDPLPPPIREMIQVEVLNGCGEKGIAKFLSDKLKAENYDVVNMGNYIENGKPKWDVEQTRLIDQIGKLQQTRELGEVMGVEYAQIESFENPSPIADITIIIGKDYEQLPIFQNRQN